jgi:thiamine-phosphate pyrophosphorylase
MITLPLSLPRVYPILDTASLEARGISASMFAEALLEGGARILQFRHKGAFGPENLDAARHVAGLCAAAGALFVVNDRADIARLLGAGVHVGQDDLAPGDARKVQGPAIVGYSTHNEAQLVSGDREHVDYLAIGPVFGTASKRNPDPVLGLNRLRRMRALTAKPLVAIGGITLANAAWVLAAGMDSIAVIAGLFPEDHSPGALRARTEEWIQLAQN